MALFRRDRLIARADELTVMQRERRDPTAATQSLQYVSPGLGQVNEWDAEAAIRLAFLSNVIVYRCVQVVATTISSVPFVAGRRQPARPGMLADTEESSRLNQLLGVPPGGPAPKLSARRLWAWTVAQRLVTGRHGWEIELTPSGDVAALWPLTSARLHAVPSESGAEWFRSFKYGRYDNPKTLPPDRIVYGWDPSMHDFRQPESPLQAARYDISIATMMDTYNVAFLRNDARPAAVVVTERFGREEDFQAFKAQFRAEYGGVSNAGKTAFVESEGGTEGVKNALLVQVLGLSQKDAQFIEQHQASLERIAMALGVPWSKLDASGRTFDNASEEDHAWWESTLLPRMADLADEVNMQLAPRLGREVGWFDTSGVRALQAPKTVTAVGAPSLVTARLATINEGRELVGLPPLDEGGDRFLSDEELAVLQGPAQLMAAALLPATIPPTAEVDEPDDDETFALAASVPGGEQRDTREQEDHEARRLKVWTTTDMVVRTLEGRWERRMRALFARQEKAALARLTGNRGRSALREGRAPGDEVFDQQHWLDETRAETADLYDQVLTAAAARISDAFAIDFDLEAEWAQNFVTARSNMLAGNVTETTYRAITEQLAEGVAAGEGIDDLAARVRHVFDVASKTRSVTIARTEVISAYNGGATLTASLLGADVVAGREWIATRDARTRGEHAEADGQVVPIDAPFSVGGSSLMYPGDPAGGAGNTVNCRCTVAFVTPEEMAERAGQISRRVVEILLAAVATQRITVDEAHRTLGVDDNVIELEPERRARRPSVSSAAERALPVPTNASTGGDMIVERDDLGLIVRTVKPLPVEPPPPRMAQVQVWQRDEKGRVAQIIETIEPIEEETG